MYHCHIRFYLVGKQNSVFTNIKAACPLEHFTHEFKESREPDDALTSKADVIFADLRDTDAAKTVQKLTAGKKSEAELVLIAGTEQTALFEEKLSEIKDIWPQSMSEKEIEFRISGWQQAYKMKKDFWQTRNYLDTTINSVPDLIWYKDKEGAHIKVNESFCKAVDKTMEQIKGRGHFYIWDIEPDEYAKGEYICMESEQVVMERRATCVFDETVKIRDEMREFKTYKSPLFDIDGSVMGTVGVASDVTQERLYEQMIINKANTDFLTGLYNRRYVYQYVEEVGDVALTIYYIDLDNFKYINDKFGHQEGDRALVTTSEILTKSVPDGLIARIGGDEFLIIVTGECTEQEIKEKQKSLHEQLEQVYAQDEHMKYISASIGTAYSGNKKIDMDALIGEADAYMYREKNSKKQASQE